MSYILLICFLILVVCIILQTIFFYKDRKYIQETIVYNDSKFISLNDDNNSYIDVKSIISLYVIKSEEYSDICFPLKEEKNYLLVIVSKNAIFYEGYNSREEAIMRLEDILSFIDYE